MCNSEFVKQFGDSGDWKLILDGDSIESTKVHIETLGPVFLFLSRLEPGTLTNDRRPIGWGPVNLQGLKT